jgi:capsular polysaccharide transport system permease protein
MHGITSDKLRRRFEGEAGWGARITTWVRDHRTWLLVVVAPTLLVAAYFGLYAANQYESEAHFMVRSVAGPTTELSGVGQALSLVGAGNPSATDAISVGDYLNSHDAVAALNKRLPLVDMFRRPEADIFTRLWNSEPTPEKLVDYYQGKVDVTHQSESGLMVVKVKAFRPADSYAIINALLDLGEKRVNSLNQRAMQSSLASAQRNLTEAEAGINRTQRATSAYRQGRRNIDPEATGKAQVGLVATLQAELSSARAQASALAATLAPNSPQRIAADRRVAALAAQVGAQEGRLTGGANNIASSIGGYEELKLRQDFAAKRYEAAAAAVEKAREQARQQQLFLVRVVEPNMPVKARYPKGFKTVATVFFGLLLAYGIGWLIAAGMKEHAS